MTLSNRKRLIFLFVWLLAIQFVVDTCAEGQTTSASRRLLINGEVVNAETGEKVETFRVIPGVRYNQKPGVRGNVAVWQPHMIREMTDGEFHWPRTRGYDEMRFRIEADGYRPATTTWLGKGGPHLRMKVHLRPDDGIKGVLLNPDGTPAVSATLAIALPNRGIKLSGCEIVSRKGDPPTRLSDRWRLPPTVKTDDKGQFQLPYETDRAAVLCVAHESGYFEQTCVDFTNSIAGASKPITIQLKNWCRVQGRVLWKDKPGVGEKIRASVSRNDPYPGLIVANANAESDAQGNYLFAYLPPGDVQLGHEVKLSEADPAGTSKPKFRSSDDVYEYPIQQTSLDPGQELQVDFGGEGTEVVGRLAGLDSYEEVFISIRPPAPNVWGARRLGNIKGNDLRQGYAALQATDYASLYFRESLKVNQDGTFAIQDVMTGDYNLWVQGAVGSSEFTVTEPNTKISIGTIRIAPK